MKPGDAVRWFLVYAMNEDGKYTRVNLLERVARWEALISNDDAAPKAVPLEPAELAELCQALDALSQWEIHENDETDPARLYRIAALKAKLSGGAKNLAPVIR